MLTNLFLGQTAEEKNFIEDLFSVHLYTGNDSTQTITNGIDLAGKGGMVWIKPRDLAEFHSLFDTSRGAGYYLSSSQTSAQTYGSTTLTAFNSNGFSLGGATRVNGSPWNNASWTFRKAPKFFDVVTYTGDGQVSRTINHSLGVAPGMIVVKSYTSGAAVADWQVYHRSLASQHCLFLNKTDASFSDYDNWGAGGSFTNTSFTPGQRINTNGVSYVAYLFAHDTTADGVIQCGSYTANNGNDVPVTLGWEPQFIIVKNASAATGGWYMSDNMRGMAVQGSSSAHLFPNSSAAEGTATNGITATATGFIAGNLSNINAADTTSNFIYLAIRRGPMRVPTDATKVFKPTTRLGNSTDTTITGIGFNPDFVFGRLRSSTIETSVFDRLRGTAQLFTQLTDEEGLAATVLAGFDVSDGIKVGTSARFNSSSFNCSLNYVARAPGFFDVVCYTGTGSARTVSHNLGVAPELMIVKRRDTTADWQVYAGAAGEYLVLNTTAAKVSSNSDRWNNTTPTSSVFSLGTNAVVNASGGTYVAYLFATCAGVSKVGTYTGTGTTKQIDCGFTNGARFVLIKRTDSTGDWYVWDTARGIVSGNDPYLLLNSTAAEVTNTDYIDPLSTGFEISSTAPAAINANGGTFVFLAIA